MGNKVHSLINIPDFDTCCGIKKAVFRRNIRTVTYSVSNVTCKNCRKSNRFQRRIRWYLQTKLIEDEK